MNTCFDNIVSMREYCSPTDPTSQIYLNDIGLNAQGAMDIITGDYNSVRDLVNATINMSVKEITTEIHGFFSNKIKTQTAIETGISGVTPDSSYTIITGGGYRGMKVSLQNGANFLNFELSAVSLFLDFTGNVNVLVYDLDQNLLLETITVAAVASQIVEVYPHSVYRSALKPLNLWIGYDATGIDSYKTLTRASVCCGNYSRSTEHLKINGTTITGDFITSNLTFINDTAGLGIRYSIWCDPYSWMCHYMNMLALPIAYKSTSEIYRRGLMVSPSTRSNNSTIVNADLMKMNFEWHESKYRQSMDMILRNIHLPKETACFSCSTPVRHAIILP